MQSANAYCICDINALECTKMRLNKKSVRSILKRVQEKKPDVKKNFTFRLPPDLYEKFVETCKRKDTNPTTVIEEFMRAFNEEFGE